MCFGLEAATVKAIEDEVSQRFYSNEISEIAHDGEQVGKTFDLFWREVSDE